MPRRIVLNNNLFKKDGNMLAIKVIEYPETFEGVISSYADRYPFTPELYWQVKNEWDKHKDSLRV